MITRILNKLDRINKALIIILRIFVFNEVERRQQMKKLRSKIASTTSSKQLLNVNSNKKRSVEIEGNDFKLNEVIVTCYFTLKEDPQTGLSRNAADFKYIQPWYNSLLKTGASGIILHDGLEKDFIKQYQNDQIQFRFCEMGNYSIFEERWLLYQILLIQLPNLTKVFFTDSNDVYITKHPFYIINNDQALYVGRDNANRIKDSGWLKDECDKFIEESNYVIPKTYPYQWVYNAGVIGGNRSLLIFFSAEMSRLIFKAKSSHHKDMTLLNIVIHENFYPKLSKMNWNQKLVDTNTDTISSHHNLISGYPLNSGFKDFDLNSKALFIHK